MRTELRGWEDVPTPDDTAWVSRRLRIPGGWLVQACVGTSGGVIFVPDPDHEWQLETGDKPREAG